MAWLQVVKVVVRAPTIEGDTEVVHLMHTLLGLVRGVRVPVERR